MSSVLEDDTAGAGREHLGAQIHGVVATREASDALAEIAEYSSGDEAEPGSGGQARRNHPPRGDF